MKLTRSFYQDEDVTGLARAFLGKVLVSHTGGVITSGIITETEAYAGISDKASHAYGNRRTARTAPMYLEGGHAYVYLIYGIHSLFNIVTAPEGIPHAILVRAIYPLEGVGYMQERRNSKQIKGLCDGPGKLTKALGIHFSDTGQSLNGSRIWIEDRKIFPPQERIITGPRIGIDYAGEDAYLPYRFVYNHPV